MEKNGSQHKIEGLHQELAATAAVEEHRNMMAQRKAALVSLLHRPLGSAMDTATNLEVWRVWNDYKLIVFFIYFYHYYCY